MRKRKGVHRPLLIFDMDGVIVDSFEEHYVQVGRFIGKHFSRAAYRDIHGGNFFENKLACFSDVDWCQYADFVFQRQSRWKMNSRVIRALRILSRTHRLVVVSSGHDRNIRALLRHNGVEGLFADVLGFIAHKNKTEKFRFIFRKYGVEAADCLFVTDTLGDLREAREVGLPSVAVTYGFHGRWTLIQGKPRYIIRQFQQLISIARNR